MPLTPSCHARHRVLGLAFYKALDSPTLARGLGILVVLYGAFSLWASMRPPQDWQVPPKSVARLSGLIGGAVGTTFGALTSLSFAMYFDAITVFFLASFHAYIVFGLARLCRIVFCAGLSLLATLLATVRLFSLHCGDAAKAEQHDENSGDESQGDPPLNATQRSDGISEHYPILFTRPSNLELSARFQRPASLVARL